MGLKSRAEGSRVFAGLVSLLISVPTLALASAHVSRAAPGSPAPALAVTAMTPWPTAPTLERRPAITVTFSDPQAVLDSKSVTMEVDSVDVTLFVKVEPGTVTYVPPADLTPGEHTVKLMAADRAGQAFQPVEWKFKIRRFAALEDARLEGNLTGTYDRAIRKPKKEPLSDSGVSKKTETPLNLFSGNVSINGLLKEEDFTAKVDANVRYVDEFRPRPRPKTDNDKLDVANYLISLNLAPLTLEVGDLMVNEGFFGAPNLARRGTQFRVNAVEDLGLTLNLFGTRYESTKGHDPLLGVEDLHESVLYGGALTVAPFPNREWLKLHVLNVRGHRFSTAPGVNVGGVVSGEKGDVWTFGATSTFFGGKLKLLTEIALSDFDHDSADDFKGETDKAYRGQVEASHNVAMLLDSPVMLRLGAEYSYVGFRFRSPANPGLPPDREGYRLKEDTIWKILTLSLGYSTFNDNTDRLEILPRVRTRTWSTGLTLAPPSLPTVSLNYIFADQRSYYEPEDFGDKRVDNFQNTYGFGASYGRNAWSVNLSGSVNYFQDETLALQAGDRTTWTTQAGVTVKPVSSLTLSPSFNYTLVDDKDKVVFTRDHTQTRRPVRAETLTGTLALAQELIPKILNLDVNVSGSSTQSSDGTADSQTYGGLGRLTWNVGNLFWDWGKQALSLRTTFNRVIDHVVPEDRNEVGIFLILDLLAPYKL